MIKFEKHFKFVIIPYSVIESKTKPTSLLLTHSHTAAAYIYTIKNYLQNSSSSKQNTELAISKERESHKSYQEIFCELCTHNKAMKEKKSSRHLRNLAYAYEMYNKKENEKFR